MFCVKVCVLEFAFVVRCRLVVGVSHSAGRKTMFFFLFVETLLWLYACDGL